VFTGVSGSKGLKAVLASLDSRQQAMILGHAVPMPVVIRTRPYDSEFYKAMLHSSTSSPQRHAAPVPVSATQTQDDVDDLFA